MVVAAEADKKPAAVRAVTAMPRARAVMTVWAARLAVGAAAGLACDAAAAAAAAAAIEEEILRGVAKTVAVVVEAAAAVVVAASEPAMVYDTAVVASTALHAPRALAAAAVVAAADELCVTQETTSEPCLRWAPRALYQSPAAQPYSLEARDTFHLDEMYGAFKSEAAP